MSKVTVVGAGNVGATCANVLAFNEVADEVVMLDVKEGVSEGKAMDMMQTAQLLGFERWKYSGTVTYSFNKRDYVVWEFPKHYLSATYSYDVMSPMDKFLFTDKDNIFLSVKTTTVDQMSYMRDATINYELETLTGFGVKAMLRHRNDEPTGKLEYLRNDAAQTRVHDVTTSEASLTLRYAPGESFVNSKQRRVPVSLDAPIFTLTHAMGFKGVLGGDYNFNRTEAQNNKANIEAQNRLAQMLVQNNTAANASSSNNNANNIQINTAATFPPVDEMLNGIVKIQSELFREMAKTQTSELSSIITLALKESQQLSTQSIITAIKEMQKENLKFLQAHPVVYTAPAAQAVPEDYHVSPVPRAEPLRPLPDEEINAAPAAPVIQTTDISREIFGPHCPS